MELLLFFFVIALVVSAVNAASSRRTRALTEAATGEELESVRRTADEDVTQFGEELQRLDVDVTGHALDEPTRQDYQRALDSYEAAKQTITAIRTPDEIRHVATTLEDGRYAVACVRARLDAQPLPVRRPPCFFNPQHGPSTEDVQWAPAGGAARDVPTCAADAERVRAGAEPDSRTVMVGPQRMPYWQAGPAYSPWVQGYFGGYAMSGLLPAFMFGALAGGAFGGWDGGDSGGDYGSGGDGGAGDGGGGDAGAGDGGGGWDSGGGGGYDGYGGGGMDGGGDFGGGDFGGF